MNNTLPKLCSDNFINHSTVDRKRTTDIGGLVSVVREAEEIRCGPITAERLHEAWEVFQAIDSTQSGQLDAHELHEYLNNYGIRMSLTSFCGNDVIDFPVFLRIWTSKNSLGPQSPKSNVFSSRRCCFGVLHSFCMQLQATFKPSHKFGFSRRFQFLFALLTTITFSVSSYKTFADWRKSTHIPYDVSICWLVGSFLGRVLGEALANYPWQNASSMQVLVRLCLAWGFCALNTALARQVLNISGHLANGMYAIVVASTAKDLPLLERSLDWSAVAVAIAVRQFGKLDCPWDKVTRQRDCEHEDSKQTRIPLVVGICEALVYCCIIELGIVGLYERSLKGKRLALSLARLLNGPYPSESAADSNEDIELVATHG